MLCGKVSQVLAMDTDTERNVRQNSKSVISSDMPMTSKFSSGNRKDAERIFQATTQWLKERLFLEISPEKSVS